MTNLLITTNLITLSLAFRNFQEVDRLDGSVNVAFNILNYLNSRSWKGVGNQHEAILHFN